MYTFKGNIAPDFVACFLACMDRSGREKEPLLVFKFVCYSLDFLYFQVLKRLKHLGDYWNLRDGRGSWIFPISFSENQLQGVYSSGR